MRGIISMDCSIGSLKPVYQLANILVIKRTLERKGGEGRGRGRSEGE